MLQNYNIQKHIQDIKSDIAAQVNIEMPRSFMESFFIVTLSEIVLTFAYYTTIYEDPFSIMSPTMIVIIITGIMLLNIMMITCYRFLKGKILSLPDRLNREIENVTKDLEAI